MNYVVKIGLIGDYSVGKSSIMNTYVYGEERSRHDSTIGVDFNHKIVEYKNYKFKLHLWDTAGQEKFKAIVKSYYRDLDVLLFIYDKTNSKSFLNLENWLLEVETINKKNTIKILIGNKKDLKNIEYIPENKLKKFISENDFLYLETSVKEQETIDNIFTKLCEILYIKILKKEINLKSYIPYERMEINNNTNNCKNLKINKLRCCNIS